MIRFAALGAVAIFLWVFQIPARAVPAFPGAEGFGANATGGRGGDVYYVNNLNSSGAGSLRYGVETAPAQGRTIIFAVSGYIPINYNSDTGNQTVRIVQNKVTVAGQTAPGDGVALWDGRILVTGDNVVIRHLRIRHGDGGGAGDCLNMDNGVTNLMLDHISMAFSTDENISSFEQSPRPDLMTFQWSLNAWGLESHSCGGLWDLERITTHHTLWAHHHTRNAKARPYGLLDWINNVTYDWDIGFIMGDSTTPAPWKANVRGNYFVCPPGNIRSVALEKASIDRNGAYNFSLHASTNLFDKDGDTVLDGLDYGYGIASGSYQISNAPIVVAGAQVPVTMDPPLTAYKKIVSCAGPLRLDALANIPLRDEVDTILVSNLVTLKTNHVSHENQTGASNNGIGYLNSTPAPVDTDLDGMPDFWEDTLGWNAGAQDHNTALANSGGLITGLTFFPTNTPAGYTRLEEYLHFLTIPHTTILRNTAGGPTALSVDLRRYTSGFKTAPVTFTFSSVSNGIVTLQPDGYTAVFTPTLNYSGRARFDFTVTDGDGSAWTQTLGVLVSSATLPRNLIWKGDGSANLWNTSALNFLDGTNMTAYASGDNVRFDDTGSNAPSINLTTALAPSSIEVDATKNYTLGGTGSLSGSGSLTKSGSGTLTIGTTNSGFTGPVDLAGGTLSLSPGTSIGSGQVTLRGDAILELVTSGSVDPANPITVPADETGTITSGSLGNELSGSVTGDSTSVLNIGGSVSFKQGPEQFSGFLGTVLIPDGELLRFSNTTGTNGGANTTFEVNGILEMRNEATTGLLGALTGTGVLTGEKPTAGTLTFSVGAKNLSTTFAGSIVDKTSPNTNTALVKVGSGTLTLTGINPHTGSTTVSAGTLLVNGTNTSSPTIVSSGGTIGGTGKIGGVLTINNGGKLSPGASAGTLTTAGGLTLNTPTMLFELSGTPAGNNDKITMQGGVLTLSGTQTYQFSLLDGSLAAGTYTLIDGGANTSGSGSFAHNLPAGVRQAFALQSSSAGSGQGYVQLTITGNPTTLVWRGTNGVNWDTSTTNWLNGATPDKFYNFDTVVIDDASASSPTLNLTTTLSPASILVNAATTRTFSGTGSLTGSGTLTKSGAGTLTINTTNNSYSGNVALTGGAITLGIGGSTLNTGNLTIGGGATFNLPPTSPAYFYSGTITVFADQSGTVYSPGLANSLNGPIASGNSNSVLYLSSGVSFGGTNSSQFDGFTGTINIPSGATLRFSPNSSGNVYGSLNPTFVINGSLRPRNAGNTIRLGALSGTGSIEGPQSNAGSGDTTYIIGGNNLDVTFNGNISSNNAVPGTAVILNKVGTGKLTLGGGSTFTGGTTVEAGSLIVNNATGSGTGTGNLSIAGAATLGGSGFIGSPTTLADFAILAPGNSVGTLTFNNDLDLGEFSVLNFELGTSNDAVVANDALTLQGTLNVIPAAGFGAGTYTLFSYNPAKTFNYSGLNLGTMPSGYNYLISTNTPGSVNLIVTGTNTIPPGFAYAGISGASMTMNITGAPNTTFYLLGSTNLSLPASNWTRLETNQLNSSGLFSNAIPITNSTGQGFFRLKLP